MKNHTNCVRSFVDRLNLDGVREYLHAAKPTEKFVWFSSTIFFYVLAAYFSYLTVLRFNIGKKVLFSEQTPPTNGIVFPQAITFCHAVFWNKTYLEETIRIPDELLNKASELGLNSKPRVLSEFAKYISYYNLIHFEDDGAQIREDVWDLMTELYEYTLKDVDFSSLVQDAVIRPNTFEKCWFNNRRYKCDRAMGFSVDAPSCYYILIESRSRSKFQSSSYERASVRFEITLPTKHIFEGNIIDHHQERQDEYGTTQNDNLGIKFIMHELPSPFTPQSAAPPNTHAVILYHHKEQHLQSECFHADGLALKFSIDDEFHWLKSYETCLAGIFESVAKNICSCHFIAGSFYPRNEESICTPDQIRKCVQTEVFRHMNEHQDKYAEAKKRCRMLRRCEYDDFISTVTYYNLENVSRDHIKNIVTIRPNLERGISESETNLTNIYGAFSEVGGVVGVYTGLSIAAVARVLALFGGAGLQYLNRIIIKPMLGKLMSHTPLSIRWELISILHYRRIRNSIRANVHGTSK